MGEQRRGRRRKDLTSTQRQLLAQMVRQQPSIGLPRLRRAIPGLPKNSTAAFLRRLKRVRDRRRRRRLSTVHWQFPGAVWAIDGTCFDLPVGDRGRRALVVVEMHSRKTLCLQSVPGERAASVVGCLQQLIDWHGAPLVLKADNGSAFVSDRVAAFCHEHGITLMHSPVRRPSWNGTCEVSGKWAKRRAEAAARHRGSPEHLLQADLDRAVTFVGTLPRIDTALRRHFLTVVAEQLAATAVEQGLVVDDQTPDHVRRSLGRVAAQRALIVCHMLTIKGREYHQWLPASAA
jgi:transposase InsO family protein